MKLSLEIDFEDCANKLANLFPDKSIKQIDSAFRAWFWEDDRSGYTGYSEEQIKLEINQMLIDFIAENQNIGRFAAKVAIEVQMPIQSENLIPFSAGAWL
jgi:hypothetical protein